MSLQQELTAAVDTARLDAHLDWFEGVRRDTAGPGEDAAVDYITARLQEYGVPFRIHEFDAFLSYPREASLNVLGDRPLGLDCLTHSFTLSTDGLQGELHYLPDADFEGQAGRIVMVDGLCTPITVLEASRAGVAGLVFVNEGDVVHNMIATTIWGTPTPDQLERLPTLSAVSIARQDGERLKERLQSGPVEVVMKARVETGWYRSRLPEALITGSGADSEQFVLVGAHYCSWEIGITDNATGDSCLLEMARILQAHKDGLNRSVRLCWWPGHSHGRYSGSTWYADTFFHELADSCVAYHNIDSPGVRDATTYVARHTTAEIEGFCSSTINRLTGQDPEVHRPSRAADQSFLANGVPAFSTYPFLPKDHPERKPWTGGCANAWWWHSSADTRDKADSEVLNLDTRISLTAVEGLVNADLLPLNPRAATRELLDYAQRFAAAVSGHLETESLTTAVQELDGAAAGFMAAAGRDPRTANRTLIAFSRILTPVTYSTGGRYSHDPAEWSPIMHNTTSGVYPGLNPGFGLDALRGQHAYGFVLTGVRRQLNRTVDAARQAAALLQTATLQLD